MIETMRTEIAHVKRPADGKRIVGLVCEPASGATNGSVVIPPGYERRIHHYAVLSRYLIRAGYRTIRFDLTNHIGVSDGDIVDFAMSSVASDVEAVLDDTRANWPGERLFVVGPSLGGRGAIRVLSGRAVDGVVLVLPVTNVMKTISQVSGQDVIALWRSHRNPEKMLRVGEHDVKFAFVRDVYDNGWAGVESTCDDLAKIGAPVYSFAAEGDDWVDLEDVRAAMSHVSRWSRELVLLEATSHELKQNPPAMRLLVELVLKSLSEAVGIAVVPVAHFEFQEIVALGGIERAWARNGYSELASRKGGGR
jgi:alpha-beta hydrolase superfamily lysophospholipase